MPDYTQEQVDTMNAAPAFVAESFKVSDSLGNVLLERNARPAPSNTTQQLIDTLLSRDAAGRAKYGTSLDRTDLSADEWAQHMLDAAGYLVRLRETMRERTVAVELKVDASHALAALPQMQSLLAAVEEVLEARAMNTGEYLGRRLNTAIANLREAADALA